MRSTTLVKSKNLIRLFSNMADQKIAFNHIAREWRMKYSENGLSGGAVALDKLLKDNYLKQIKDTAGVTSVQRVVCGGCNDFKVVVKVTKEGFGAWEGAKFAPEEAFLADAQKVSGVTNVETQNYTLEEL